MNTIKVSLLAALLPIMVPSQFSNHQNPPAVVDLTVEVTQLKNKDGQVGVFIFPTLDGFPDKKAKTVQASYAPIGQGRAQVRFKLPTGSYYLSAFHDENKNGIPDRNWIGIPKEGVGASNNPIKGIKPDFNKARVNIKESGQLTIEIKYLL